MTMNDVRRLVPAVIDIETWQDGLPWNQHVRLIGPDVTDQDVVNVLRALQESIPSAMWIIDRSDSGRS